MWWEKRHLYSDNNTKTWLDIDYFRVFLPVLPVSGLYFKFQTNHGLHIVLGCDHASEFEWVCFFSSLSCFLYWSLAYTCSGLLLKGKRRKGGGSTLCTPLIFTAVRQALCLCVLRSYWTVLLLSSSPINQYLRLSAHVLTGRKCFCGMIVMIGLNVVADQCKMLIRIIRILKWSEKTPHSEKTNCLQMIPMFLTAAHSLWFSVSSREQLEELSLPT